MCGVAEAQLALAVVGTVAKHQNDKAVHEMNTAANEVSMQNANQAYLNDLSKIDNEASRATQAKALAELKARQELTKNQAYALNSGFGNSLKVMQDMSGEHDLGFSQYLSFANFLSSALQVLGAVSPDDIGVGFFNDWEADSVFFGKFLVLY